MKTRLAICVSASVAFVACGGSPLDDDGESVGTSAADSVILKLQASSDRKQLVLKGSLRDPNFAGRYPNLDRVDNMIVRIEPDGTIRSKCTANGKTAACNETPFLLKSKTTKSAKHFAIWDALAKPIGNKAYDQSQAQADAPDDSPGQNAQALTQTSTADQGAFCIDANATLAANKMDYRVDCSQLPDGNDIDTIGGDALLVKAPKKAMIDEVDQQNQDDNSPSPVSVEATETDQSASPTCNESALKKDLCDAINGALESRSISQTIVCSKIGTLAAPSTLVRGAAKKSSVKCSAITGAFAFQGPPASCRSAWWSYQSWLVTIKNALETTNACLPDRDPDAGMQAMAAPETETPPTTNNNTTNNNNNTTAQPPAPDFNWGRAIGTIWAIGTVVNWANDLRAAGNRGGIWRFEPLVLDLDGNGINLSSIDNGATFDLLASGDRVQTSWTDGKDAFLAIDRNRNGAIDDSEELFGELTEGRKHQNGFMALSELDINGDGRINASDPEFNYLVLWVDRDRNGVSSPSELIKLQEAKITTLVLATSFSSKASFDSHGNNIPDVSSFIYEDGRTGAFADVYLRYRPLD